MMKLAIVITSLKYFFFGAALSTLIAVGASDPSPETQSDSEATSSSVVRNKIFYKAGKIEFAGTAGLMPYDDVNNHYLVGAKVSWHLGDHWGWEILDAQKGFASVTDWTNNLVATNSNTRLQTAQLNFMGTSNIVFSPLYGKIRIFGSSLVYFDTYLVAGAGLASTETLQIANSAGKAVTSSIKTGMDPVFDFGLGFKLFLTRSVGLVLDLRDYVVFSETYGRRTAKSNYSVLVGVNFFIPNF
ncbi:MAG: outer membrane beta-barrel domain-containing protein [Proteobacteria bacterium]|nr:outer membrane beta-barrel domain-containing protein [Pseudomonadota bacterium]NDC23611.1 outer membrane beta-barrel domain-containing protein [Pseudomonadota bacterium]NDD05437.1 outer membrane beta-barrel domain-containing protein [Pseudomonadota bacterium]NDG28196.1 outer membrane beta-barrel domain-containing protein [Pseudomonadota bacterium]